MNTSGKPDNYRAPASFQGLIGIGITIAALGVLGLLLGVAEHFRAFASVALVWFAIGAVLVVIGGLITAVAWSKARR